jgi:hypothetical protein
MLKEQGIECARRTVAKYREALRRSRRPTCCWCAAVACSCAVPGATPCCSTCTAAWPARAGAAVAHPYRSEHDLYARPAPWPGRSGSPAAELQGRGDRPAQPAHQPELCRAAQDQGRRGDRFRAQGGACVPDVEHAVARCAHLRPPDHRHEATLYIDTSGEPLFKRGWREDKGDAPLKETLAAAMIAASGWDRARRPRPSRCTTPAAAAAPLPSRLRRSPATSRRQPAPLCVSRSCCRSSPMCGRHERRGPEAQNSAPAGARLRQ